MHDVEVLMGGPPTIKVRTQARMSAVCVPLGCEVDYSAAHNWRKSRTDVWGSAAAKALLFLDF